MIDVVAAVIKKNNLYFIAQRNRNKHFAFCWEFPGGKVDNQETFENALKREIKEELNIDIIIKNKFKTIIHNYPDFSIKLHSYICSTDNFHGKLYEHSEYKLLKIDELKSVNWLEADIPLIDDLILEFND